MVFGKALEGSLQGFWRYRVGKFRIICKIDNNKMYVIIIINEDNNTLHKKNLQE